MTIKTTTKNANSNFKNTDTCIHVSHKVLLIKHLLGEIRVQEVGRGLELRHLREEEGEQAAGEPVHVQVPFLSMFYFCFSSTFLLALTPSAEAVPDMDTIVWIYIL